MAEILDLRQYHCPIPLLMTKRALQHLAKGAQLEIYFGRTSAVKDFEILCAEIGVKINSCENLTALSGENYHKMKISN